MKKVTLFLAIIIVGQAVTAQQLLERVETSKYELRWNDAGSRHKSDIALWHPIPPVGYAVLGDVGFNSNTYDPNGKVITYAFRPVKNIEIAKDKSVPMLAVPVDFTQIWLDKGSGASNDGGIWLPVCPENYIAAGFIVSAGYKKPSASDCACLINRDGFANGKKFYTKRLIKPSYTWLSSGVGSSLWEVASFQSNIKKMKSTDAVIAVFTSNLGRNLISAETSSKAAKYGVEGIEFLDLEPWVYTKPTNPDILIRGGKSLVEKEGIFSANKKYMALIFRGSLVIMEVAKNTPIWRSNNTSEGECKLTLQNDDGNLCLKKLDGSFVWCSMKTDGQKVVLENDGRLVQYDKNNKVLWSSK